MASILRYAALILLVLATGIPDVGSARAASTGAPPPLDPANVEDFFDGLMAAQLQAARIPGATVAVVADGEILLTKGYGYADMENQIPVDGEETLFRPGSISKLFTWTAVMQLVEAGKLDLDADVNTYLDFEIPQTYPDPITLYDLMGHTPGFEDRGQGLFFKDPANLPPLGDYLKDNLPQRVYAPGEIGAYSNYGTALAGYIVERVSGEPFSDYIDHQILEPLEMDHSTFRQPLPPDLAPQMAKGYAYSNGTFIKGEFEIVGAPPAGALSATARDMAKFMIAHLQDGRYQDAQILEETTAQEMHRQHVTPDPRVSGMAHGFMEQKVNGRRLLHHGGDTFLFHSGLYLILEEQVGVFVSYNSAGAPGNAVRDDLLYAFMNRYFPAPETVMPEPPADFAERAAQYEGEYQMARANFSSPEKILLIMQALQVSATPENTLMVTMGGQPRSYVEIAPQTFQNVLNADDRAVFITDEAGDVTGVQVEGLAPLAFVKAPFYATSSFNLMLLVSSVLFCLTALLSWPIAFIARGVKLVGASRWPRVARFWAAGFALLTIIFVLGFFAVFGNLDPAYGVPEIFFGPTPTFTVLMTLLPILLILGAGVLVFTLLAWFGVGNRRRGYWTVGARLHYTTLAFSALAMVWLLSFWQILGGM